jgi:hypothetical protein
MEKLIKIGNTGVTTAFQVKHFSIKGKKINFLEFMYLFKIYCISMQVQYRGERIRYSNFEEGQTKQWSSYRGNQVQ